MATAASSLISTLFHSSSFSRSPNTKPTLHLPKSLHLHTPTHLISHPTLSLLRPPQTPQTPSPTTAKTLLHKLTIPKTCFDSLLLFCTSLALSFTLLISNADSASASNLCSLLCDSALTASLCCFALTLIHSPKTLPFRFDAVLLPNSHLTLVVTHIQFLPARNCKLPFFFGSRIPKMGCAQSRIDNQESLARCKERKNLMRDAVVARNAFATDHSGYAVALKNTGSSFLL